MSTRASPCLRTLALALGLHLACAASSATESEPAAPAGDPPAAPAGDPPARSIPGPHHALAFEARNVGCRDFPLASYRGRATLDIERASESATFEIVASADDLFAGIEIQGAPPRTPAEPLRCRWRGQGAHGEDGYTIVLRPDQVAEGCGGDAPFELRCRAARLDLPDARGDLAPADVLRCAVTDPHPTILWVLLAGEALVLGDDALRSAIELVALGGAHQRLVRGTL